MKAICVKQLLTKLKYKLQSTERELLESIAAVTGFIQRKSSKLCGWDFFQLMTTEHFNEAAISLQGLCDVLRTINRKAELSAQALHQRMNSKNAVAFMEEVFTVVYKKHLAPMTNNISQSLFESFNRIFLQDSTQIELHEYLADDFKGSGGGASKSAMKIDLVYEIKQSIMEKLTISSGTVPDQSRAAMAIDIVKKGDLIIRDLGYFALDVFREIARKGAYYLSRHKHHTTIYLSSGAKAMPVNPLELIQKNLKDNVVDIAIFFRKAETSLPNGCL